MNIRKMFLRLTYFLSILIINGCGNPQDFVLPTDIQAWESNKELKEAIYKLSDDEKKLLAAYAMKIGIAQAFGGEQIKSGTTIGEAIEIQKSWQVEKEKEKERQKILADEIHKAQLAHLKEMNDAITVTLLKLNYKKSGWEDNFEVEIGIRNNTDFNISGIKGTLVFKDMFGDLVKQNNLSNDSDFLAHSTGTLVGKIDYNQFEENDKRLRQLEFSKIQFEWMPDVYIFSDGRRLEMPKYNNNL